MRANNGGPAFPRSIGHGTLMVAGSPQNLEVAPQGGMSLRDYFAAKAMHAELLSAGSFHEPAEALIEAAAEAGQTIEQRIAVNAYLIADAMLAERDKGQS